MNKITDEAVKEMILKEYQRIEELEWENRKLREMRDRVIRALMEGDKDTLANDVRDAVFGDTGAFKYQIPWRRKTRYAG